MRPSWGFLAFSTVVVLTGALGVSLILRGKFPKPIPVNSYPHVAMYSRIGSAGKPFAFGGNIDTALVRKQAQWDYVVLDVAAAGTAPRTVATMLRQFNPKLRLYAFSAGGTFFVCGDKWAGGDPPYGCDTSATNYLWSRWRVIRGHNAVLMGKRGPYGGGSSNMVDFSRPGVGKALAENYLTFADPAVYNGGLFTDEVCRKIGWTQALGDTINYTASGFPSFAAWDSAYSYGVDEYFARLKSSGRYLVGNCGPLRHPDTGAWMWENFPYQPGESVQGYVQRDSTNWLTAWWSSGDQSDPANQRRFRYTFATASFGPGMGALTGTVEDAARGFNPWWWDEYAVNGKGVAVEDPAYNGWLGAPQGPAYGWQGLTRRDFAGGIVILNDGKLPVTARPGAGYFRIRGFASPYINDGTPADSVQVAPQDALFLTRRTL